QFLRDRAHILEVRGISQNMTRRNISQVGRIEESRELTSIIREFFESDSEKGGLRIVGISGYGGVGKTFLFERALQKVEAAITPQQFESAMRIRVDGANAELLKDFVGLFNDQFATRILP